MDKNSIVIPTFNGLTLLQRCLHSIYKYTPSNIEIIIVDNGSTDDTKKWCENQDVRFIALEKNFGFPIACNRGLEIASGSSLLLLNNDVIVTSHWLENLNRALYSTPEIGIVGPVTNRASGSQQVSYRFRNLIQMQKMAARHNYSNPHKWKTVNRIVGLCFLFKRELLGKIGNLDERFSPGHYEDDDYCFRARKQGYKLLVCHDTFIYHQGSVSFKKLGRLQQRKIVHRNYKLFKKKWNVDPRKFI